MNNIPDGGYSCSDVCGALCSDHNGVASANSTSC
jgi:hypothetical protein